jgi:hypothetical protein
MLAANGQEVCVVAASSGVACFLKAGACYTRIKACEAEGARRWCSWAGYVGQVLLSVQAILCI